MPAQSGSYIVLTLSGDLLRLRHESFPSVVVEESLVLLQILVNVPESTKLCEDAIMEQVRNEMGVVQGENSSRRLAFAHHRLTRTSTRYLDSTAPLSYLSLELMQQW